MYVDVTDEAWETLKADRSGQPIHMMNLIRYREKADYSDGRDVSGIAAYAEYGRLAGRVLARYDAHIVWSGIPEQTAIGPSDETWDLALIVEYPSSSVFVEMVETIEYKNAKPHRQAAIADSRLIRMAPLPIGAILNK